MGEESYPKHQTSSVILGVQIKVSETQYHVHQCMFNIDHTNKKLAMCDMWLWYLLMMPNSFCHLRKMGTVASTVQIRRPYLSAISTKVVSWCLVHACRKVTCEVWAPEFAHLKEKGWWTAYESNICMYPFLSILNLSFTSSSFLAN